MIKKIVLSLLLSLIFTSTGNSFYMGQLVGAATPQYIQEYFDRMWIWYNEKFFNFNQELKPQELELIKNWRKDLNQWGEKIDEGFYKDSFQFSHKVVNGKPNHSLFFIASKKWSLESIKKVKEILQLRKIQIDELKMSHLLGLQWNVEEGLFSMSFQNNNQIEVLTFKDGKEVDRSVEKVVNNFKMPLNLNKKDVVGVHQRLSSSGNSILVLRLKSFFVPYLSPEALYISQQHFIEFNQSLDFVEIKDKENYILHYP